MDSTGTRAQGSRRPRAGARVVVWCATRALPRGEVRERYLQEFTAELYTLPRRRQGAHALGVLASVVALRSAVTGEHDATEEVAMQQRSPVGCRLNVHHVWHTYSTEDGNRWQECERCGKPRPQTDHFTPVL